MQIPGRELSLEAGLRSWLQPEPKTEAFSEDSSGKRVVSCLEEFSSWLSTNHRARILA